MRVLINGQMYPIDNGFTLTENYNETLAKEHIEKHFYYAQQINKYFRCHSFEDFTNLKYLNKIEICKI